MLDEYNTNKQAFKYLSSRLAEVNKLCIPLKTFLGIENFGYLRIYNNLKYYYVTNEESVAYDYLLNVKNSHIFYEKDITSLKNEKLRFVYWPKGAVNSKSLSIYLEKNLWNGATIISQENPEYTEMWWFLTKPENEEINTIYHKYFDMLLALAKNFSIQIMNLMPLKEKYLAKYDNFDFSIPIPHEFSLDKKVKDMLNYIYQGKPINVFHKQQVVKLTPREIDCLKYMAHGYSGKEIAYHLNLSNRTVEKYIQSMHQKFGVYSRSQIINIFENQVKKLILP